MTGVGKARACHQAMLTACALIQSGSSLMEDCEESLLAVWGTLAYMSA